ncbi:MAG: hypothetical protein ABI051_13135 [Vicinamibacterales bacterium]
MDYATDRFDERHAARQARGDRRSRGRERLKIKHDTVRRLFMNEPGVIVIWFPRKGTRTYRTLRIPLSVYQRVVTRLTRVA